MPMGLGCQREGKRNSAAVPLHAARRWPACRDWPSGDTLRVGHFRLHFQRLRGQSRLKKYRFMKNIVLFMEAVAGGWHARFGLWAVGWHCHDSRAGRCLCSRKWRRADLRQLRPGRPGPDLPGQAGLSGLWCQASCMGGPNSRKARALWHTGCAHRQQLSPGAHAGKQIAFESHGGDRLPQKERLTTLVRRFSCEHSTEE